MKELKEHSKGFSEDLDEDLDMSKLKDYISMQLDQFYKENKANLVG